MKKCILNLKEKQNQKNSRIFLFRKMQIKFFYALFDPLLYSED